MREERVDVKIRINEEVPLFFSTQEPEWRKDQIPLSQKIWGIVWLKVEIVKAFFPPGDSRELGMAFQSIRFVNS